MKATIITANEMSQLSEETRNQIAQVIEATEITIQSLKDRIKALKYQLISYRDDMNEIADTRQSDALTFKIWFKTAGEQWGNNAGREYVFKIGRKYINVDKGFWNSERGLDYSTGTEAISIAKFDEFLRLIEEAQNCGNEVDEQRLLTIVAKRIAKLFEPELY